MVEIFGIGEDYLLQDPVNYVAKWEALLSDALVSKWKFNVVRLAFSVEASTWHGGLDYAKMDAVLEVLDRHGCKAILDLHNFNDHLLYFGSQAWKDKWLEISNHYKNDPRIYAYQPFNEPFQKNWANSTWTPVQIPQIEADLIDLLRFNGDNTLVILSDPYIYGLWSYDTVFPIAAKRPNTMLGKHFWASSYVQSVGYAAYWSEQSAKMDRFTTNFGIPLIIDEFGLWGQFENGTMSDWTQQMQWAINCVNYTFDHPNAVGAIFWQWSKDCHYTQSDAYDKVLQGSKYVPPPPIVPPVTQAGMSPILIVGAILGLLAFIVILGRRK